MSRSTFTNRHDHLRQLLIAARESAGITQSEVAVRLQRPQSFVSKYERGDRRLDVLEFLRIARVLGVDPCDLLQQVEGSDE